MLVPSVPCQRPLLPGVEIAHEQDRDEDQHLDQGEEAELLEDDGPGEDEHRLDVEDHEQHRNNIVSHRDLGARVVKDRRGALVGHEFGLIGPRGPDEIARQEGTDAEGGGDHQEKENRQVVLDDQIGHQGVTLSRGEPDRRSGSRRASRKYGSDRKPSSWGADMPLCWIKILYVVPMPSGRSSSRIAADWDDSGSRPAKADSMPKPIRKCNWFVKPVTSRPAFCPAMARLVKSTCAVRSCWPTRTYGEADAVHRECVHQFVGEKHARDRGSRNCVQARYPGDAHTRVREFAQALFLRFDHGWAPFHQEVP